VRGTLEQVGGHQIGLEITFLGVAAQAMRRILGAVPPEGRERREVGRASLRTGLTSTTKRP
jgi:hypothetical protein